MATATPLTNVAYALAEAVPGYAAGTDTAAVALRLLDTVACALGAERLAATPGSGFEAIHGIVRLAEEMGGTGGATVWATGTTTTGEAAALRNGVAARYLDFNDTYVSRAIVHPSDVVPVLVAQAEIEGCTWSRLAEAVTVAYEVFGRLADQAGLRAHGFEASSLTPLAAAAGCAWLAGMSMVDTANALNLACIDAATLRAVRLGRLSHWKAVASARGAAKGWFAVRAARAGLRAPDEAFDSPDGFTARISGPLVIAPEDRDSRLHRVIVKRYPIQIFIQQPAALAARLHPALNPGDIDEVVVSTFREAVDLVGAPVRADLNAESADHSLRFGVAAMLRAGRLGPGDVHRLVDDPAVRRLAERVQVVESPGYTEAFPRRLDADIEVRLAGGARRSAGPDGDGGGDRAALGTKFRGLTKSDTWDWPWRLAGDPPPTDLDALLRAQKGGNGVESH
jgi:2-methylcitrate dehydratase